MDGTALEAISPATLIAACSAVAVFNLIIMLGISWLFRMTVSHQIKDLEAGLKSWVNDLMERKYVPRRELETMLRVQNRES